MLMKVPMQMSIATLVPVPMPILQVPMMPTSIAMLVLLVVLVILVVPLPLLDPMLARVSLKAYANDTASQSRRKKILPCSLVLGVNRGQTTNR